MQRRSERAQKKKDVKEIGGGEEGVGESVRGTERI